jgi:hypothetical protein
MTSTLESPCTETKQKIQPGWLLYNKNPFQYKSLKRVQIVEYLKEKLQVYTFGLFFWIKNLNLISNLVFYGIYLLQWVLCLGSIDNEERVPNLIKVVSLPN